MLDNGFRSQVFMKTFIVENGDELGDALKRQPRAQARPPQEGHLCVTV